MTTHVNHKFMKFVIQSVKLAQKCRHASGDICAVSFVLTQHYPQIFNAIKAFQRNTFQQIIAINNSVLATFENEKS